MRLPKQPHCVDFPLLLRLDIHLAPMAQGVEGACNINRRD
jgi:hypothetical protein